jgi:hypothetical protein
MLLGMKIQKFWIFQGEAGLYASSLPPRNPRVDFETERERWVRERQQNALWVTEAENAEQALAKYNEYTAQHPVVIAYLSEWTASRYKRLVLFLQCPIVRRLFKIERARKFFAREAEKVESGGDVTTFTAKEFRDLERHCLEIESKLLTYVRLDGDSLRA